MADLAKTDAQYERFLEELGALMRIARWVEEIRRRLTRERTQVVNAGDVTSATPHLTGATLTGVDFGANTSDDGKLWLRWVANGGNWDVHLYTAAGASGEVGTVTNVAASATTERAGTEGGSRPAGSPSAPGLRR